MEPSLAADAHPSPETAPRISARARQAGFALTAAQTAAAAELESLLDRVGERRPAPARGAVVPEPRSGVYLWGEVGRGKSWLMDAFLACVGHDRTWRVHYHELFRRFHEAVHAGSEPRGGDGRTAVEAALDALIGDRTVLCIDEFSVNDIADGMLSYRLFTGLFARGLHLVVTSNYPPDDLLAHPVYHELYLPGIAQLTRELTVIEVGGATDLRTTPPGAAAAPAPSAEASRASADAFRRGRVFRPADSVGVDAALAQWGLPGSPLPAPTPTRIPIGHHEIVATAAVGTALRIDFDTLCRGARATLDYLHLTDRFTRVVIDGVPRISREPEAVRRRWINLVDVLYDRAVDVVLVSEYPLADLMDVDDANRDTARTNSRLALLGPGTD